MRRIFWGFVIGGILGVVVGFAAGIFVYPFWFLNEEATEEVADIESQTALAQGEFVHADPRDPIHYGKGSLTIYRAPDGARLLHLERDFEVGPGPRFHVYLVSYDKVRTGDDFQSSQKIDLGRLKAFRGSQNYAIPEMALLDRYKSVVIWCKEFDVLISPATLVAASGEAEQPVR